MNLKNILITNKELGLQKNHEISLIKSGKKKYIQTSLYFINI